MNCPDWEERIALYVGGDESTDAAGETRQHLEDCARCREFAASLEQDLTLLRAAHAEPVAAAHLTAVRQRVLEQIEPKRRSFRLAWVGGIALATAAAIALTLWPNPHQEAAPRIAVANPRVQQIPVTPPPTPAPRPVVRPRAAKHRQKEPPAEPLLVKLVTDDPNVVIYWIAN